MNSCSWIFNKNSSRTVPEKQFLNSYWTILENGPFNIQELLELFVEPALPEVFLTMAIIEQFKFNWSYPPQ